MKTEPQDIIVKPGETVLVAITFPAELDKSEACCAGIVLEDFLASRNAADWMPRVHSVLSNARALAQPGAQDSPNTTNDL